MGEGKTTIDYNTVQGKVWRSTSKSVVSCELWDDELLDRYVGLCLWPLVIAVIMRLLQ